MPLLSIADGSGAYNRYFGRLDTGKMKIRGVMARKGDTPEYVRRMQQELFDCLGEARSREELCRVEPKAQEIYRRYVDGLADVDVRELATHRRVSRLNYSRRCAEASAVKAHLRQGISLALGMEIGYVVRDAGRWEVETERERERERERQGSMLGIMGSCWRRLGARWLLYLDRLSGSLDEGKSHLPPILHR